MLKTGNAALYFHTDNQTQHYRYIWKLFQAVNNSGVLYFPVMLQTLFLDHT
jgi:hypothetical protein